jgi:hypothetical protein
VNKPFKHISLIERYKTSGLGINTNPTTTKQSPTPTITPIKYTPNQGSTTIGLFNFTPTQGSTTPKPFIIFPSQGGVIPKTFLFKPQYTTPTIRYDFPDQLSLKDRVEQRNLGTTKHLPQFFLSDVYTDYIKIVPFGIFNHTSTIVVKPFGIFEHTSDTIVNSFGIFTHTSDVITIPFGIFTHTSNIIVTTPIQDVSGLQGIVVLPNGVAPTNSFIVLSTPTPLIQSPSPEIDLFNFTPNQGSVIINTINFTPNQGSTTVDAFDFTPNQGSTTVSLFDFTPEQGGVQYKNFIVKVKQYDPNVKFELFNFVPEYNTIQIKTVRYTADRLLATVTPKIKHGSADLPYSMFEPDKGKEDQDPGILFTEIKKAEQQAQRDILIRGRDKETSYKTVSTALNLKYKATKLDFEDFGYKTTNQEQLEDLRKRADDNFDFKDFRESLEADFVPTFNTNPSRFIIKYIDNIKPSEVIEKYGTVDQRKKDPDTANPDLIDFIIGSRRNSDQTVQFTAYLTTFGHTITPNWSDINYVGRQDTLRAFKGVTQGVSLGFITVAFDKEDMPKMYDKLTKLARITSFGEPAGTYLKGPACDITVGKWFVKTPCIFTNVKYDIETAEYPWDIDRDIQMPHYIRVSLEVVLLGDNKGEPLGANPKIFNYGND